jgi:hypothetical protein
MGRKATQENEVTASVSVADSDGDVVAGKALNIEVSSEDLAKQVRKFKDASGEVKVKPIAMQTVAFQIEGNAPLVENRWTKKAAEQMTKTFATPKTLGRKGRTKTEGRDYEAEYKDSYYVMEDGGFGIPCSAFRQALIRACALVDQEMTIGKCALFIQPDGFDTRTGTPLVRIQKGKPTMCQHPVLNNGRSPDIRTRSMWAPGWKAVVRVDFDSDLFTVNDVVHLLQRAGIQIGVMEGRPFSKKSAGMGWGTFLLKSGLSAP